MNALNKPATQKPLWTNVWIGALLISMVSLNVMVILKGLAGLPTTCYVSYYPFLAAGFLKGKLELFGFNPTALDLSPFHGHIFAYWPPLVSLLMMPFVAIRGPFSFPQRSFGILLAAVNSGLCYGLIRRLFRLRGNPERFTTALLLACSFAFGSSNLLFGVIANHWWIGQLAASPFLILSVLLALDRSPATKPLSAFFSSCSLSIAIIGRVNMIPIFILLIYLWLSDENFKLDWALFRSAGTWKSLIVWLIPLALAGLSLAGYNYARFGRWSEFGTTYHNAGPEFYNDFKTYGYFSLRYIPRNIYYYWLRLPGFEFFDHQSRGMGYSLFVQCPWLVLCLRKPNPTYRSLIKCIGLVMGLALIPATILMSPGYGQYGARYLFDIVPLMVMLICLNSINVKWLAWLTVVAILINTYGIFTVPGIMPF